MLPALEEIRQMTIQWRWNSESKEPEITKKPFKLGPQDFLASTQLKIHSSYLLNILRSVVQYTAGAQDEEHFSLGVGTYSFSFQEL
jgi:hypothetical protein